MGHLRIGTLPRTRKWREVVDSIGAASGLNSDFITALAEKTLDASSQTLRNLPLDSVVQKCFLFLTALSVAGQAQNVKVAATNLGIEFDGDPTKLQLSRALRTWLEDLDTKTFNPELANLARQATTDTISTWINKNLTNPQLTLFAQSEDPFMPWRKSSNAAGFCELSRIYFSNFTTRYLNYFLSRTASAQFQTLTERENFSKAIQQKVDLIAQHALETSKLVQHFSAGWFTKHANNNLPSEQEVEGFLRHSFEKIREELRMQKEAS